MLRYRKFTVSAIAFFMLLALKVFLDLTYVEPSLSTPTEPPSESLFDPLLLLEPLHGQEELSMLALHNLAQGLRRMVIKSKALWNREELELLNTKELRAWGCKIKRPSLEKPFYEPLEKFLLYGGCRDQKLIIDQPDKCVANKTFLLLAIKSSPANFAQRQAVRSTWGMERSYNGQFVRLVFLLGTTPGPDLSNLLFHEDKLFHDLLQWDFQDTFFNLTLKDQLFLGWASLQCPDARYILKGDDDVFARTSDIVHHLNSLTESQSRALYMGHVVKIARPYRDSKSKYYIPPTYFDGWYPPYAGGGGYVFSGALTHWLYLVSHFVTPFPIDDVYTGMCFKALGVNPIAHPRFRTFETPCTDKNHGCIDENLLLVHKRNPQELIKMWKHLQYAE
ncbi:UDP-GlcNAc:betaGal beta-1,3-N-acetylglucosaminyltransferase 8 [Bombina bombina]|uniref:UDP-GlcNAc:betaGal beta-1,3-N-acetylglucosaminyltransferase 8 n=1 Tax=Bombina bombina TaxID=8345 RepID=UPI00235A9C9C|nr:UDP-GlcNAc:betaGal beta-1,3-N-acetylglucosaminyltransferase 8 [Bombina bombina]